MEEIFSKLEKAYLFDKRFNTIFAVIETILGIVAGVFIKAVVSEYSHLYLILSVLFTLLFLCLVLRRTVKQENFSLSGLGELKATIDLQSANKEIERKNLINAYIEEAIVNLNANTCDYTGSNVDKNLCDQSVANGLGSMYKPFISNTPNLLDTGNAKFSVGVYLHYYCVLPPIEAQRLSGPFEERNVFLLKDDLNTNEFFVSDMLEDWNVENEGFEIQRYLLDSFKHRKYVHATIQIRNIPRSLICAPIPDVCDTGSFGVFFVIGEPLSTLPNDLEKLMAIFGRLFSNWLVRYNECVKNRCKEYQALRRFDITPEEQKLAMADLKVTKQNENGSGVDQHGEKLSEST